MLIYQRVAWHPVTPYPKELGMASNLLQWHGSVGLRFVGLYSTDAKVPMIQKAPPFNSVPLPCAEIQV